MKSFKKKNMQCLIIICAMLFTGCGNSVEPSTEAAVSGETNEFFAMDTYMTVTAYGTNAKAAVDQAQSRVEELENKLSTEKEDSEVSLLNQAGAARLQSSMQMASLTQQHRLLQIQNRIRMLFPRQDTITR